MKLPMVSLATLCRSLAIIVSARAATTCLAQTAGVKPVTNSTTSNQLSTFELKPTAIAPIGAKGSARIASGSLAIHLSQVGPGVYDIEVVGRTEGSRRKLGTITIVDPTTSPSRQATDNKKEASASPESVMVETEASVSIPAGARPLEITRVLLLGAGGNAILDSKPK